MVTIAGHVVTLFYYAPLYVVLFDYSTNFEIFENFLKLGIDSYIIVVLFFNHSKQGHHEGRQPLTAEAAAGTREGAGAHRRYRMTKKKYDLMVMEAIRTGAAIAPDGTQLIYNDGMFCAERYFAVYDVNGNCVDVAYSSIDLYYLFK